MKSFLPVAVVYCAALSHCIAAPLVPLNATGWNQDIVVGASETISGTTATMDGGVGVPATSAFTWYGVGYNGAAPSTGLPVGVTASQATPADLTFSLQPFDAFNAIFNGGTLTLTSPAPMLRLALIGSSTFGASNLTITVNHADLSSQVFGPGLGVNSVNGDWYFGSPVAYTANGRVQGALFGDVNAGNPRLYQSIFSLSNTTSDVTSVVITNGNPNNSAIMAISGEPVPEPSSALLLLCGGVAFLGRRSRRPHQRRA